ncbi:hypothetical protein COV61_00425 [Candidatus Micrarchaeota archaeon CG11_big_fil_rev_8_21_14_0_20_47_5]|nr:MAG: hypothetical protein AUJ17_02235 [Candidatus Micrarchaeota archaeon CG1_02_47_40]PIN84335.1 MAG: hypothetical protein COV61_00425 [Candidatus Micrarchaeota archaeon CG11_big_fil_rev_8_21_14_0_20_47_5]
MVFFWGVKPFSTLFFFKRKGGYGRENWSLTGLGVQTHKGGTSPLEGFNPPRKDWVLRIPPPLKKEGETEHISSSAFFYFYDCLGVWLFGAKSLANLAVCSILLGVFIFIIASDAPFLEAVSLKKTSFHNLSVPP